MNLTIGMIIFSLSGVIFFIAGVLAVKPLRTTRHARTWLALVAACFVFSFLNGYTAYQEYLASAKLGLNSLASMILMLVGSGLVLLGIILIGKASMVDTADIQAAISELERYRSGFDKVPFMIVIKDHQGNYLYTNSVYQYFLGKKGHNLVGDSDFKFFPRAQALTFRQEEDRILESGIPSMHDEEVRGVDGVRWIRFSRIPLKENGQGKRIYLVAGQDITQQKQVENDNIQIKQSLDELKDALPDLPIIIDRSALLDSLVKWFEKLAYTNQVGIWQILPDHSAAVLRAGGGKLARCIGVQIKMGRDLPWKAWQSGRPLLVEKYQNWPDRTAWIQDVEFTSAVGFPIKANIQSAYVLTVYFENNARILRSEQIDLLSILADSAANQLHYIDRKEGFEAEDLEWRQKYDKAQNKARIEHILAVMATYFINVDMEKIDDGITHALETMVKLVGIDRAYLVLFPVQESEKAIFYSSPQASESVAPVDFQRPEFQEFLNKLNQLEIIHYPHVNALAPERDEVANYLQAKGIKSFTAIPLIFNRSLAGYLGFEANKNEVEWSQDILALWKIFGEMFVNLIDRKQAQRKAGDAQEISRALVHELELRTQENALIAEMGELLQACRTADEAFPIIIRYMQKLITACSGALYLIRDAKDPAEKVADWGNEPPGPSEHELAINECWALRRGRVYSIADPATEPVCGHIREPLPSGYMCVPLIAQGELVGILHFRMPKRLPGQGFRLDQQQLAVKLGEYIAIPITNLKLRDELRSQAIRDPLTRLYNRRYMEETLEREIRRANRHSTSVGIIMFDIDGMKPINDRHGHDAGDLVLKTLGSELIRLFRGEDVACRYGGDEFTVVLPEATLADVWRRAEQMREAIRHLDLKYDGKQIGPVTISIGVAAYPDHGSTAERVLLACDAASYTSKSEGGDRIMMGHQAET